MKFGFGCGISQVALDGMPAAAGEPVNYLLDSSDLDSAAWSGDSTFLDLYSGQDGPWGAGTGHLLVSTALNTGTSQEIHQDITGIDADWVTYSAYIKDLAHGAGTRFELRFYNSTKTTLHVAEFEFSGGVPALYSSLNADASGVESPINGFYRVYVGIDFATRGYPSTDIISPRIVPFRDKVGAGSSFMATGYQIDNFTTPGPYKATP